MDWNSMRDADLECFGSETSDLILKTTASKCLVCHTGDVVQSPDIKEDDMRKKGHGSFLN